MRLTQSYFLLLILATALVAVMVDYFDLKVFVVLKPLTTILILLYPFIFKTPDLQNYAKWIGVGLLFCLMGDSFLLFDSQFVWGLASFLIGHLFFLFAFVQRQGWQWQPFILLVLGLFGTTVFMVISKSLEMLFYPVLVYLLVILTMSWQGWALALNPNEKNVRLLGWGVSLFLFSDTLIAIDKFYSSFSVAGILILTTYWTAIFLIAKTASK